MADLCVANENWLLPWKPNAQQDNELQQASFIPKDQVNVM
jgi:hypothetical protein